MAIFLEDKYSLIWKSKRSFSRLEPHPCRIQNCNKKHYALSLCRSHYNMKRYGSDPEKPKFENLRKPKTLKCRICGEKRCHQAFKRKQSLCEKHYYEKTRKQGLKKWYRHRAENIKKARKRYLKNREKRLIWQSNYYINKRNRNNENNKI